MPERLGENSFASSHLIASFEPLKPLATFSTILSPDRLDEDRPMNNNQQRTELVLKRSFEVIVFRKDFSLALAVYHFDHHFRQQS